MKPLMKMKIAIQSQKVFRFQFNPNLFGWSNPKALTDGNSHHLYTYQPSLKGLPDMPYWMRYKYSRRHRAGNIFWIFDLLSYRLLLDRNSFIQIFSVFWKYFVSGFEIEICECTKICYLCHLFTLWSQSEWNSWR